jgi:hypothetical protein
MELLIKTFRISPTYRWIKGTCDEVLHRIRNNVSLASETADLYVGAARDELKVPVMWASSFGYQFGVYNPSREEILVGPLQPKVVPPDAMTSMSISILNFSTARQLYGRFETQGICNHRALVMIPYAVHSYGIVEVYSLSISIFAPSLDFALRLNLFGHDKNVNDDTYCGDLELPPTLNTSSHMFSPEDRSEVAQRYWLKYADLYHFPHIQYFESFHEV